MTWEPLDSGCEKCHGEMAGVQILGVYDGVCYWMCLRCGDRQHRFDPPGRIYDAVERYWARTDIENAAHSG